MRPYFYGHYTDRIHWPTGRLRSPYNRIYGDGTALELMALDSASVDAKAVGSGKIIRTIRRFFTCPRNCPLYITDKIRRRTDP